MKPVWMMQRRKDDLPRGGVTLSGNEQTEGAQGGGAAADSL